jgi:hypothetical protein
LHCPEHIELALKEQGSKEVELYEYCKLSLYDPSGAWSTHTVKALIAPGLCSPVILGLPFSELNKIVVDHELQTVISKLGNFDLLNPKIPLPSLPPKPKLQEVFCKVIKNWKAMVHELKATGIEQRESVDK